MGETVPVDGHAPWPDAMPPRPEPAPRRVLVIDDDEVSAQGLALILHHEGYEARVAYDGESALEIARTFRPAIVLSDLGLPGIDGHELARRIRRDRELCSGLKLLAAVTGQGAAEVRRRSREVGFDHHLLKPIDPEAILALIASLEWCEEPGPVAAVDRS